jgi:outer membrane immunogenic protein
MKKYSLAILASCIAMPVMAADVPANEPVVAEAPPAVYDWTGFSVGVHAGVAGGDVTDPFSLFDEYEGEEILSGELGLNNGGVFGGGGVGADYQFSGGFVVGVLADISATDIDGKLSIDLGDGNNSFSAEAGSSVEWFATPRGRIGYAWDRLLIYGTGGAAFGEVESSVSIDINGEGISESVKTDHFGWTAGAGLEYAITDRITFKTEYLFVDLGSEEVFSAQFGEDVSFTLDAETKFHTLKAGANFRF